MLKESYLNKNLNKRFGRLLIVEDTNTLDKNRNRIYKCLCDCGNIKLTTINNLKRCNSCGCLRKETAALNSNKYVKLSNGEASLNSLIGLYKKRAKSRNLEFSLTKEQFKNITSKICHYCDVPPKQENKVSGCPTIYVYNGIDRVNPNIGYLIENCVPCCKICNRAKMDLSYEEFLEYLNRIKTKGNIKNE